MNKYQQKFFGLLLNDGWKRSTCDPDIICRDLADETEIALFPSDAIEGAFFFKCGAFTCWVLSDQVNALIDLFVNKHGGWKLPEPAYTNGVYLGEVKYWGGAYLVGKTNAGELRFCAKGNDYLDIETWMTMRGVNDDFAAKVEELTGELLIRVIGTVHDCREVPMEVGKSAEGGIYLQYKGGSEHWLPADEEHWSTGTLANLIKFLGKKC